MKRDPRGTRSRAVPGRKPTPASRTGGRREGPRGTRSRWPTGWRRKRSVPRYRKKEDKTSSKGKPVKTSVMEEASSSAPGIKTSFGKEENETSAKGNQVVRTAQDRKKVRTLSAGTRP